ncbi:MAG: DUF1836 domain-containing protein [bacterium]|nr:DUF1836 domain-containing protein [bacterium]
MKLNNQKLEELFQHLESLHHIPSADIPNIDLYMDQVTTLMEKHLGNSRRYPEDKILTKTMINNYAKNNLLPPPNKKRYTKEHILLLVFIYYFKNLVSIGDIEEILRPISEHYFAAPDSPISLEDIYNQVFSLAPEQTERMKQELFTQFESAQSLFPDLAEEDQDTLRLFAFICELSHDVYMKKMLIEKLVDEMKAETPAKKK